MSNYCVNVPEFLILQIVSSWTDLIYSSWPKPQNQRCFIIDNFFSSREEIIKILRYEDKGPEHEPYEVGARVDCDEIVVVGRHDLQSSVEVVEEDPAHVVVPRNKQQHNLQHNYQECKQGQPQVVDKE